jgi:hypothetical protein
MYQRDGDAGRARKEEQENRRRRIHADHEHALQGMGNRRGQLVTLVDHGFGQRMLPTERLGRKKTTSAIVSLLG